MNILITKPAHPAAANVELPLGGAGQTDVGTGSFEMVLGQSVPGLAQSDSQLPAAITVSDSPDVQTVYGASSETDGLLVTPAPVTNHRAATVGGVKSGELTDTKNQAPAQKQTKPATTHTEHTSPESAITTPLTETMIAPPVLPQSVVAPPSAEVTGTVSSDGDLPLMTSGFAAPQGQPGIVNTPATRSRTTAVITPAILGKPLQGANISATQQNSAGLVVPGTVVESHDSVPVQMPTQVSSIDGAIGISRSAEVGHGSTLQAPVALANLGASETSPTSAESPVVSMRSGNESNALPVAPVKSELSVPKAAQTGIGVAAAPAPAANPEMGVMRPSAKQGMPGNIVLTTNAPTSSDLQITGTPVSSPVLQPAAVSGPIAQNETIADPNGKVVPASNAKLKQNLERSPLSPVQAQANAIRPSQEFIDSNRIAPAQSRAASVPRVIASSEAASQNPVTATNLSASQAKAEVRSAGADHPQSSAKPLRAVSLPLPSRITQAAVQPTRTPVENEKLAPANVIESHSSRTAARGIRLSRAPLAATALKNAAISSLGSEANFVSSRIPAETTSIAKPSSTNSPNQPAVGYGQSNVGGSGNSPVSTAKISNGTSNSNIVGAKSSPAIQAGNDSHAAQITVGATANPVVPGTTAPMTPAQAQRNGIEGQSQQPFEEHSGSGNSDQRTPSSSQLASASTTVQGRQQAFRADLAPQQAMDQATESAPNGRSQVAGHGLQSLQGAPSGTENAVSSQNARGIGDAHQVPGMALSASTQAVDDIFGKNLPGLGKNDSATTGAEQNLPSRDFEAPRFEAADHSLTGLAGTRSSSTQQRVDGSELSEGAVRGRDVRLVNEVWSAVQTFRTNGAQDWVVRIRPDQHTELNLRLIMQNDQLVVHAKLESGNWEKVAPGWNELQASLADRGIQVRPLESGGQGATNFNQFGSNAQAQRDEQREQREFQQFRSERSDSDERTGSKNEKTKPEPARRANQVLETWA